MKTSSSSAKKSSINDRLVTSLNKLKDMPIDEKFDEVSLPVYLHKNFLVRKIFLDRFRVAYGITNFKDKTVLDYGCGSGIFLDSLSSELKNGIGVDLDITIAKKVITSEKIILKQIKHHDELRDLSEVDIITSFDVLEHVIEFESLLKLFQNLLYSSGEIIISGPTENLLYSLARKIANIGIKGNLKGGQEHVRNITDIKNKMIEAGFVIKKEVSLWNLFKVVSFTK